MACIDIARREDFYHTCRGFLVHDASQIELFDQAFNLFWSGRMEYLWEFGRPKVEQRRLSSLPESDEAVLERPSERQWVGDEDKKGEEAGADEREQEPSPAYSPIELLRHKDFSEFTPEEVEQARRFIGSLLWRADLRLTRRKVQALKRTAHMDFRRVLRRSMGRGGEIVELAWRKRKLKPRRLVVICDISGSMQRYSRLFLNFLYALAQDYRQVEAFVFGTRLTRITPALRRRQVDQAIDEVSGLVLDFAGGTRIGECLERFNYGWGRRVLGRGAMALVISDGWDRGDIELLEREIARLHRSVHRLIWLNPLLGSPDYQPLVRGIQAVRPHVDDFLPLHNLASMEQLAQRLGSVQA